MYIYPVALNPLKISKKQNLRIISCLSGKSSRLDFKFSIFHQEMSLACLNEP